MNTRCSEDAQLSFCSRGHRNPLGALADIMRSTPSDIRPQLNRSVRIRDGYFGTYPTASLWAVNILGGVCGQERVRHQPLYCESVASGMGGIICQVAGYAEQVSATSLRLTIERMKIMIITKKGRNGTRRAYRNWVLSIITVRR